MGGEGAHIVETRMFCTVCLDLSQTLIQTIQILKEEKHGPKPMEEQLKDRITPHVNFFQQAAKER